MNAKPAILCATLIVLLLLAPLCSSADYARIMDLTQQPHPPNPVTVSGSVTLTSPLTIDDGSGALTVTGVSKLDVGDYVVITGDHSGGSIAASKTTGWLGPARMEMIWVPPGSFTMGNSGVGDDVGPWVQADESPSHMVSLSGYWIGKYEVTRSQYRTFMDAGGYTTQSCWSAEGWQWHLNNLSHTQPTCWDPVQSWLGGASFTQTDKHPVACPIWYEADAFCRWANMRLPTEAEWERAARWDGTHSRIYPWGDTAGPGKANCMNDTNPAGGGLNGYQTAPVGSYPGDISPIGCMDMGGNLCEMLADRYDAAYYSQTPSGGWIDPAGPAPGEWRCVRGGSWMRSTAGMRCAARGCITVPYGYWYEDGFRAAR